MRIILDAMGGDNAPLEIVKGALQAHRDFGVDIVLTGREEDIRQAAAQCGETLPEGVTIRHCTETIEMCDDPALACRRKKDSSMTVGLQMLRAGEGDAFISAGSTGALLSGATLLVKRVRGIRRAAMAPLIPTAGGDAVLVDCGANIDCTPEYLLQFAYIGNFYARHALKLERPRVALLNIGAEESKGTPTYVEAHALLKANNRINFVGNVEPRDIPAGVADVVVADGFTGNVILKLTEGLAKFFGAKLKGLFKSGVKGALAYLLLKGGVADFKKGMDADEYGGAPFLGAAKPVIKAHGSSNARAVHQAIRQAKLCVENDLCGVMARNLTSEEKEA